MMKIRYLAGAILGVTAATTLAYGASTTIKLFGSGSGDATITVGSAAGTATVFQLPANNGTNTYVLQTNGSGVTSWVPAAGGTTTIANGAKALLTTAIGSAACTSVQTATATGALSTDVLSASFNGDPTAVTGYIPLTAGMLTIVAYPTADTANFKVCNNTSSSITPGAITLNWQVIR